MPCLDVLLHYYAQMRCPLCHAPLQELSPCCPQCHFDVEQADRTFGIPPQLQVPLTDLAEALTKRQARLAQKTLTSFPRRFPQMFFYVVTAKIPAPQNISALLFWMFNRGGLCTPLEKGGSCYDALLLLDTENHRAACIIGYGLEPFVTPEALQQIAQAALPALRQNRCYDAIQEATTKALEVFAAASAAVPRSFGLHDRDHDLHESPLHDQSFAY